MFPDRGQPQIILLIMFPDRDRTKPLDRSALIKTHKECLQDGIGGVQGALRKTSGEYLKFPCPCINIFICFKFIQI